MSKSLATMSCSITWSQRDRLTTKFGYSMRGYPTDVCVVAGAILRWLDPWRLKIVSW